MYKHLNDKIANNILFRKLFLIWKIFCYKRLPRHHSQYGEDAVIDRLIDIRKKGFFVDVGCFHPIKYNNTYKLYKKGWRGINIDLDSIKIEGFNLIRPADCNIVAAVSDKEETVEHYSFGFFTLTSSLDKDFAEEVKKQGQDYRVSKIKAQRLDSIIEATEFAGRKIDLLSIDVEGHDLQVLKSLDFETYAPGIVMVELHAKNLAEILENEIYVFLKNKGYDMVNWTGPTLIFKHQ